MIDHNALLLRGLDVDLTVFQNLLHEDPQTIARSSRTLIQAAMIDCTEASPVPPVRLHADNVILLSPHLVHHNSRAEAVLAEWLKRFDWPADRQVVIKMASTNRPIEDGYFQCMSMVAVGHNLTAAGDDSRLEWQPVEHGVAPLPEVIARFMFDEVVRVGGKDSPSCERYIRDCYDSIPDAQLTHKSFALLDYPVFDMGSVLLEFAGSVRSTDDIRFWSRAAYYHK